MRDVSPRLDEFVVSRLPRGRIRLRRCMPVQIPPKGLFLIGDFADVESAAHFMASPTIRVADARALLEAHLDLDDVEEVAR